MPPGPGQESVWDYPRPPRVEPDARPVRVEFAGEVVAASERTVRVLETAGPPVFYLPREDVRAEYLEPVSHETLCEWKGVASYFDLCVGSRSSGRAVWCYRRPDAEYEVLRDRVAFHAGRVDACFVGDEQAVPQPGEYYGGWITSEIVGPFKGEPGSDDW